MTYPISLISTEQNNDSFAPEQNREATKTTEQQIFERKMQRDAYQASLMARVAEQAAEAQHPRNRCSFWETRYLCNIVG